MLLNKRNGKKQIEELYQKKDKIEEATQIKVRKEEKTKRGVSYQKRPTEMDEKESSQVVRNVKRNRQNVEDENKGITKKQKWKTVQQLMQEQKLRIHFRNAEVNLLLFEYSASIGPPDFGLADESLSEALTLLCLVILRSQYLQQEI